ncbi:MAG TPA: hypothetical protein VGO56_10775 [Pyrinomonadaceae bacterium]|nr:hypothetical protein [Pyrinomonadaceae bacterium]
MNWLHPNREEAGREYQRIRALLTKHFQSHGCFLPDKLADATMDRGAEKLTPEKIRKWVGVGTKERYFYRVAYYILLEAKDKSLAETQMPDRFEAVDPEKVDLEPPSHCLEKCLQELAVDDRELIERYYRGEKAIKKQNRVELARDRNIDLPSLRVRAHRIRRGLRRCIDKCLQEAQE